VDCCPEPDETLLGRYSVSFATGTAASVDGRRSFRDRRRHDIEPEFPGWPEGSSTFSVRRLPGKIGVYARDAVSAPFVVAWGILCDLLGGSTIDPEPGRGKNWRTRRTKSTTSQSCGPTPATPPAPCPGSSTLPDVRRAASQRSC
jgi:hypothetical protein